MLILLLLLVAGYTVTLAVLFWLQGRLVYPLEQIRAVPRNRAADAIPPVVVRTADGLDLPGRYAPASAPDACTVILFHGNGEDLSQRATIANDLIAAGHGVFLAEYRGYGGAPGHPNEAGLYADGRAALAFVAERSPRIVLFGFSLGSGVAVQLATEWEALVALVLEAPFTCMPDVARAHFPLFAYRWMVRDRYDNLSKIGRVRAPVLICGGRADDVVPPVQFKRLYDAVRAPRQLVLLDDAGHVDVWERGGRQHVLRFLHDRRGSRANSDSPRGWRARF